MKSKHFGRKESLFCKNCRQEEEKMEHVLIINFTEPSKGKPVGKGWRRWEIGECSQNKRKTGCRHEMDIGLLACQYSWKSMLKSN